MSIAGSTTSASRIARGYTLLELMIAMFLGMLLSLAAISNYSSNKSSYFMSYEAAELEANARVALEALHTGIEHAGYPSNYVFTMDKAFYIEQDGLKTVPVCEENVSSSTATVEYEDASRIFNNKNFTKDANNDQISIIYYPDDPTEDNAVFWQDCGGSYTANALAQACSADPIDGQGMNAQVYNSFYIDTGAELKCRTSRNGTYPITNGIEHMQFRYGVRVNGNTRFKSADQVTADDEWGYVISVQVGLLVRSTREVYYEDKEESFVVLDKFYSKNDRYMRRVFSSTIQLRNMNRET